MWETLSAPRTSSQVFPRSAHISSPTFPLSYALTSLSPLFFSWPISLWYYGGQEGIKEQSPWYIVGNSTLGTFKDNKGPLDWLLGNEYRLMVLNRGMYQNHEKNVYKIINLGLTQSILNWNILHWIWNLTGVDLVFRHKIGAKYFPNLL